MGKASVHAAAAFLLMPLGVLAPKALTALLAIAGILAVAGLLRRPRWPQGAMGLLAGLIAILLGWALLSLLWMADPGEGLGRWLKLAGLCLGGLALTAAAGRFDPKSRRRVGTALVVGFAVGLAVMAIDLALAGGLRRALVDNPTYFAPTGLNRAATIATLLIWPTGLWLWRRWRPGAVLLLAACAGLLTQVESASAYGSLAVAVAAFLLVAAAPRPVLTIAAAAVAATVLISPLLPLTLLAPQRLTGWMAALPSPSVHRLYIWQFTAARIAERPILGWGLDSSRAIPGADRVITTANPSLPENVYGRMTMLPLHPHNVALQLWLELGLPGALALALLLGGLLWLIARRVRPRVAAAAAAASVISALSLSSFSYGIWQNWWIATLWLCAAVTSLVLRDAHDPAGGA